MDSKDRPAFVEVLAGLAEIYHTDLTKERMEIYWRSMQDWSIEEFKGAADYLLMNCEYMPKPYDFEQLRKKGEIGAHDAWSLVMEHADGAWRHGGLGDPKIDRVVRMLGGYSVIALSPIDKLGFVERRFLDTYDDLSSTDAAKKALPDARKVKRLQDARL